MGPQWLVNEMQDTNTHNNFWLIVKYNKQMDEAGDILVSTLWSGNRSPGTFLVNSDNFEPKCIIFVQRFVI